MHSAAFAIISIVTLAEFGSALRARIVARGFARRAHRVRGVPTVLVPPAHLVELPGPGDGRGGPPPAGVLSLRLGREPEPGLCVESLDVVPGDLLDGKSPEADLRPPAPDREAEDDEGDGACDNSDALALRLHGLNRPRPAGAGSRGGDDHARGLGTRSAICRSIRGIPPGSGSAMAREVRVPRPAAKRRGLHGRRPGERRLRLTPINSPGHLGRCSVRVRSFRLGFLALLLILTLLGAAGHSRRLGAARDGPREASARGPDGSTTAERTWDWDDSAYSDSLPAGWIGRSPSAGREPLLLRPPRRVPALPSLLARHVMDLRSWALKLGSPSHVEAEVSPIHPETAPEWSL